MKTVSEDVRALRERLAHATAEHEAAPFRWRDLKDGTHNEARRRAHLALQLLGLDDAGLDRLAEALATVVHGYACGCEKPWPTNPDYFGMSVAMRACVVAALCPTETTQED